MKGIANKIPRANRPWVSILLFWLILTPVFSQAKELGEQQVRSAVQTWVRYVTADARPNAVIERMEPYQVNGKTVAYIAHLSGGGFCLCGADDLVLPVYLYSPKGTYDRDNPNYQYILWEIETRLKNLQTGIEEKDPKLQPYEEALAERAVFWQDLSAGRMPRRMEGKAPLVEPDMIELPVTSHWTQRSPYNNSCPIGDVDCTACPNDLSPISPARLGCVATATAQIMKYWNWPLSGTEERSYPWDGDDSCDDPVGAQELSADLTDPYEWQNMPDDCESGCSQAQQDALAELCYEVAVALETDFGVCGSFSSGDKIDDVLKSYFRYHEDGRHSETIDIEEIAEEIQWLRPVAMRGSRIAKEKGKVGHAWVIYGYNKGTDPDREFKVNMGWGGYFDDWYTLDNVYGPNGVYNLNRIQVTRIAPRDMAKFVGDSDAGDGSPDNPYKDIDEALAEAPEGATLMFKAGSDNTFSGDSLVINRRLTLKGKDVTIRKGAKGVVIHPH